MVLSRHPSAKAVVAVSNATAVISDKRLFMVKSSLFNLRRTRIYIDPVPYRQYWRCPIPLSPVLALIDGSDTVHHFHDRQKFQPGHLLQPGFQSLLFLFDIVAFAVICTKKAVIMQFVRWLEIHP